MNIRTLQPPPPIGNRLPAIRCRQIDRADLDAIADLLVVGFPRRTRDYWVHVLDFLTRRTQLEGFPKYGYMLESGATPVGVLLILSSQMPNSSTVRCNGSAWYVMPPFRSFATILIKKSLKRGAIHTNLWPDLLTLPTIEAIGFRCYCRGVFAAVPALAAAAGKARIRRVVNSINPEKSIPADELRLLRDHDSYGCLSLWCETEDGGYPFIFRRRFVKDLPLAPVAQLIYCPSIDDLVRLAGAIGRYLALRGMTIMLIPANGRIPKLIGKYFDEKHMYYLGPESPDIGDLAYTKAAFFAI